LKTEIIPGIYRLEIPIPNNPLGNTNVYLLRGTDGYLMIDAGWNNDKAFKSLLEQLSEIGISPDDISRIVITHAHADHYGLVGRLKERTEVNVILHHIEADMLANRAESMQEFMSQTQEWFDSNGVPPEAFPTARMTPSERRRANNATTPDSILHGDETISTGIFNLEVLWTPGHSPGHICLYERSHRILFTGDHILPGITPNISLQPHAENNPLGDFLKSLRSLRHLEVETVLPAHEHIFTDLQARIDEILEHHRQRTSEITATLDSGPKTAYEISAEITWMPDFGGCSFSELAPWDRRMAILETLAHLKAIEEERQIIKEARNGIFYYRHNK
jgi:glyoxylase-like metal-dependent hydrolase (beta-lactamase superfamily II)